MRSVPLGFFFMSMHALSNSIMAVPSRTGDDRTRCWPAEKQKAPLMLMVEWAGAELMASCKAWALAALASPRTTPSPCLRLNFQQLCSGDISGTQPGALVQCVVQRQVKPAVAVAAAVAAAAAALVTLGGGSGTA